MCVCVHVHVHVHEKISIYQAYINLFIHDNLWSTFYLLHQI